MSISSGAGRGVLVTLKRDGRPQLSNVDYTFDGRVIRLSTTADRAKVRNMLRDPRVSFYVSTTDGSAYTVAEGIATVSAAACTPDDATVEELIDVFRKVQGQHPDWPDYRRAMVEDGRLVVRIDVERCYGYPDKAPVNVCAGRAKEDSDP